MHRRNFLKCAGFVALSSAWRVPVSAAGRASQGRPNFVFILIDDLGWKDLGFMGSGYYQTPRVDALAREGVVFTSAYANAPNCAPTRACLMSGQYAPRHGIYTVGTPERGPSERRKLVPTPNRTELGTDHVTLADALKSAGYTCGCIGKWHLGDKAPYRPQDRGFDVVYDRDRRGHFVADGAYLTDRMTDKAIQFVESHKDRPFFLYLSHHAVHTPIQAKPELVDKYKGRTPEGEHDNPVYAAMVESVDQSVGRVLDTLDRLDLTRNTVMVFFSDNGGYANATSMEPLRGSKGMLYEGGIRVPAIVRWPGVTQAGRRCDVPIIGIDFYPTVLEIAGVSIPSGYTLDGESLVPLLEGGSALEREAIFWHFPAYLEPYNESQWPWRTTPAGAVRKGDWKLIEFFEDGGTELYHLAEDPGETHDLAARHPQKTRDLQQLLRQWRQRLDAPVPTERNHRFDPQSLRKRP